MNDGLRMCEYELRLTDGLCCKTVIESPSFFFQKVHQLAAVHCMI
jgi:hypothetical protein